MKVKGFLLTNATSHEWLLLTIQTQMGSGDEQARLVVLERVASEWRDVNANSQMGWHSRSNAIDSLLGHLTELWGAKGSNVSVSDALASNTPSMDGREMLAALDA